MGMRVPEEGTTLLIDYGRPGGRWWRSGMGHAEYTHTERMLFHFEQIVRRFYLPTRRNATAAADSAAATEL